MELSTKLACPAADEEDFASPLYRREDITSGVMDVNFFKNQGKILMGDIYQKVEGILQDVDNVTKQDRKSPTEDQGKTSKKSVDLVSEFIQGLRIGNSSPSNQKSPTALKSPVNVENKPFFINTDQSRLGLTIIPEDKLSDNTTSGISNLLLDVEYKSKVGIFEKSEMEPTFFSGPDVNKPGVSTKPVKGEDGKTTSEEPISMDTIVNGNFMSDKYDEVNNHFSIETSEVKVEPLPFSEDRFDTSVNFIEDNAKDADGSGSVTEDHTFPNANAVHDQMETKSSTNHHNDNAANSKFDISPIILSLPSGPNVGNTCADSEKISGIQSYKKNMQIQVPFDKPVVNQVEFGMETIDLHDEVAMEESSSVIDAKELFAVSKRVRKLRSFREKIQDAFTAKRRLAKDYELLSIWYGDIDFEASNQYRPQDPPSTPVTVSDAAQKHQLGDSEWVLL